MANYTAACVEINNWHEYQVEINITGAEAVEIYGLPQNAIANQPKYTETRNKTAAWTRSENSTAVDRSINKPSAT